MALSSDGSIYAVGVSDTRTFDQFNGHQKFIVTKVTTSGALDVGFDGDGIAEVADFGLQNAAATAVVVQADGRPVVAGYGAGVGQIARFTSTGALDTTFGTRGRFSVDGVKPAVNIDLKVQADGNLILTGDDVAGPAYFTARIRSEGSIDKDDLALSPPRIGYNFDGKSSSMALRATDLTGATAGRAIIQVDGKIVVSGGFGSLYSPAVVFDPSSSPLAGTISSSAKDVQVRFLSDALSPRPVLTALDHTTTNPYNIVVTITDDVLNDVASINANDFRIVYPTGTPVVPTLVSVSPGSNAKTVVVTLNVPPPGGAWNTADSNTNPYLVELVGAIQDTNGNAIRGNNGSTPASLSNPRSLGGFQVRINPPTIVPPAATLNAASVTNPAAQPTSTVGAVISQLYRFTVTYTDDVEVNGITIGNSDIIVTGPNFFSQVATVSPVGAFFPNSGSITVTYQIIAPRGTFDITDNGVYTVTLRPNQVSDTDLAPNYVTSGPLGQFSVNVSSTGGNGNGGETGGAPPVVSLVSILPLTTTDTSRLFTLVFDDDVGLNLTSINGNSAAIRVTGPRLYNELAVFVSMTNNVDGTVSALYTVPAPDGIFDPGDNGTYSISALPNQIADIDPTPNFLPAGTAGTFVVNVPYAVPTNGQLLVNGTDYDDTIHVTFDGFNYRVTANNILQVINGAAVTAGVNVMGHSGNDSIVLGTGINGGMVGGGPGNDSIYGSDGADNLSGGQGDDLIRGNDGNDVLLGRVGNDTVGGGKGDDYVGGGQDVDQLFGGDGDDTLFGGVAGDYFDGGAGNDLLRARDVTRDTILGGEGDDSVEADFGLDYGVDELIQV